MLLGGFSVAETEQLLQAVRMIGREDELSRGNGNIVFHPFHQASVSIPQR